MQTKVCVNCFVEKSLNDFYIYSPKQIRSKLRCTECMSERYRMRRYEKLCQTCSQPAALDSNQVCKKCNKNAGLYQCRGCNNLLPLDYSFDGKHRQCRWCMKEKRRSKKAVGSNLS